MAASGLVAPAKGANPLTPYDDDYRSVINVADEGADRDGVEPITPVLKNLRTDNTLLYFPPGRYYMDSQFKYVGFDNFGIYGNDATLIPADYYRFSTTSNGRLFVLGTLSNPGGRVRFENLRVVQTTPDTGVRVIDTAAKTRLIVRGIQVHGQHDSGTSGPARINLTTDGGRGVVDDFHATDGGEFTENTPNAGNQRVGPTGILANDNRGTLVFRECRVHQWPNNGLYASGGPGTIKIRHGWFKNNNVANLRIGGQNSDIQNPVIEVSSTRPGDQAQRGIRIERGSNVHVQGAEITITSPMPTSHAVSVMNSVEHATIENTAIKLSGNNTNHGIVISPEAGETVVRDTTIAHNAAGGYPVWMRDSESGDGVHLKRVRITGEAGDGAGFRDGIRCGRNNSRISESVVDQRGRNGAQRNAAVITGSNNTISRSTFRADGFPYVDEGSGNQLRQAELVSYRDGIESVRFQETPESPPAFTMRMADGVRTYRKATTETWHNVYE